MTMILVSLLHRVSSVGYNTPEFLLLISSLQLLVDKHHKRKFRLL